MDAKYGNDAFKFGPTRGNPSQSKTKKDLRDFIRDFPNLLGDAGYRIAPVPQVQSTYQLSPAAISKIAKGAHRLWCKRKTAAGWRYGTVTDHDRKIHQALLPWSQLPKSLREFEMVKVAAMPVALMEIRLAIDQFERDPEWRAAS